MGLLDLFSGLLEDGDLLAPHVPTPLVPGSTLPEGDIMGPRASGYGPPPEGDLMGPRVPTPNPGGAMDLYRNAIASIESAGSGDYSALGPKTKGDRAYGRYQIMGNNIGPWSEEVLGRRVSVDEFMANPSIQDAIFDGKFGGYVSKYGPEGAAQAWFGGPGSVGKSGRSDVLGTSVGGYGQKFMRALSGGEAQDMGVMPVAAPTPAGPQPAQGGTTFDGLMQALSGGENGDGGLAPVLQALAPQQQPQPQPQQQAQAMPMQGAQFPPLTEYVKQFLQSRLR